MLAKIFLGLAALVLLAVFSVPIYALLRVASEADEYLENAFLDKDT